MTISADDFTMFCERTIDAMVGSVSVLDDEQVNTRPDLDGANSPFALVTHALGAALYWTEHVVLGEPTHRDRASELEASGATAELIATCHAAKARFAERAPALALATSLQGEGVTRIPIANEWTVGAALMHAYEELAQHLGHLEITVDLVGRPIS